MPKPGHYDNTYPTKLKDIGLTLLEEFKGSKKHHILKCDNCGHEWSTTPVSKIQAHKKYGQNGCPVCRDKRKQEQLDQVQTATITNLKERGIDVISKYTSLHNTQHKLTFHNNNCGHTFESYPGNIVNKNCDCPICGIELRKSQLTQTSKDRSEVYKLTAPEWDIYRHDVYALTRESYKHHSSIINPNNHLRGKAGVDGAYHLDHIVPVRWCFDNSVPIEVCAHHTNLQMMGWRENVGSRDKIKPGIPIPIILKEYI